MSCEAIRHELDDYVDDALGSAANARVAAHLDACPACAGLMADLRRLRDAARTLGPIAPPDRVWRAIADRIRPASAALPVSPPWWVPARRAFAPWTGLAAALVLIAAALVSGIQRDGRTSPSNPTANAGNVDPGDAVKTIAEELLLADRLYSSAIERLETLADVDTAVVGPTVAESLRRNQAVLDRAIAESRAALEQDPTNRAARESLFQALRQKLGLLQDTVALVNGLRTRPEAGAAAALPPGKAS